MKIKLQIFDRLKFNFFLLILTFFSVHSLHAQGNREISGTIIDALDKMPVVTANVVEKGKSNGTFTDMDGKFSLKVSDENAVLVITYLGYKTKEVAVKGLKVISIELAQDVQEFKELVLVGYGSVKKSDLTGSVATVSSEELLKRPVTNVTEALTGQIAGVRVNTTEGSPDAEINIRIRGGGSLSQDSSPLLIVDGFPVTSISDISPSNIENVTVLKDASATAIYGSRGAYGVILITTKSGTTGNKVEVSYNTFTGFNKIQKTLDVLSPSDYVNWQYEYAVLNNDVPEFESFFGPYSGLGQYNNTPTNNWQKNIFGRTGIAQNHDLGIRGGSDKINYSFNYTHYDLKAIMASSDYKRDNLALRLKSKPSDKISLSLTMRYSNTEINGGGANEQNEKSSADSRMKHFIGYAPFDIPGITSDDTDEDVASNLVNPYITIADNDRKQFRKNYNMLGGITWNITNNLQLTSDFGLDFYKFSDYRFYGRTTY